MDFEIFGRPTWTEINLSNLVFNYQSVKDFINSPVKFMAVIKADAYGHCAIECAKALESAGIDWFGVALPEEGLELRTAGIKKPILCLGSFWESQAVQILKNDLTPVIYQTEIAEIYNRVSKEFGIKAKAHIKIDTGMGRIGVRFDEVENFADEISKFNNIEFEGIMTHFASADSASEKDFTNLQIERFDRAVEIFESKGFHFLYKDLANSPASLAYPKSYGNMVRLGGILYGLGDDVLPDWVKRPNLKPVMSLYSKIAHIKKVKKGETVGYSRTFRLERDSLIATIPIGYQDGYRRGLSNRSKIIVKGGFAPVVGRISMDWTIIDVTDADDAKIGDVVILIGEDNNLKITAEDLAKITDTISYEITCGINKRVTRKYVGSE